MKRWKIWETDSRGVVHEFVVYAETKDAARKIFGLPKSKMKLIKEGIPLEDEIVVCEGDLA